MGGGPFTTTPWSLPHGRIRIGRGSHRLVEHTGRALVHMALQRTTTTTTNRAARQIPVVLTAFQPQLLSCCSKRTSMIERGCATTTARIRSSGGSLCHYIDYQQHRHQQLRPFFTSLLPESITQGFSIWGGSAFLIKLIHGTSPAVTASAASEIVASSWWTTTTTTIPYWACFAIISIMVRTILFPLVLYGAQTSVRLAKVIPEIQFLLTLFQNDFKRLRQNNAPFIHRIVLMRTNAATLGGIYKLHQINPFSIFLSPLLQMPIFIYISVDLRKIVNGRDPVLAQQLVDSPIGWIPDLTEPDPWFGLPILIGLLLYWNMEVSLGRRSLSGPATSKSDTAILLKDLFQSGAVFMPCFTSQLPSGIQIYVFTSFLWTVLQSAALRTDSFRLLVGLPSLMVPPPTAKYAQEFIQLKQLEEQARKARGIEPLLGQGVLALNFETSLPGIYRPSTIQGSTTGLSTPILPPNTSNSINNIQMKVNPSSDLGSTKSTNRLRSKKEYLQQYDPAITTSTTPFIHGVSAPWWQLEEQRQALEQLQKEAMGRQYMPQVSDEVMDKANKGELPREPQMFRDSVMEQLVARAGGEGLGDVTTTINNKSSSRMKQQPFQIRMKQNFKGKKGKSTNKVTK